MMTFHGDRLVPAALCRLLYQTVPEALHLPVAFYSRYPPCLRGRSYVLGDYHKDERICIHLNAVFRAGTAQPGSYTAAVWRELLATCYHEVGHHATPAADRHLLGRGFPFWSRQYAFKERLADEYAAGQLARLRDRDPRLAQPRRLDGYLGIRFERLMEDLRRWVAAGGAHAGVARGAYARAVRFLATGAQLSAGDALALLGAPPAEYPGGYAALRAARGDLGIRWTDAAGRAHRLYDWGDLPALHRRLAPRWDRIARTRRAPCGGCGRWARTRPCPACAGEDPDPPHTPAGDGAGPRLPGADREAG